MDKISEIESNISELEGISKTNKDNSKEYKARITANKKQLTKLKKNAKNNKDEIEALENENEQLNNNLKIIDEDEEKNKLQIKTLKSELKTLNPIKKVGKATKKQALDATGVINIDEYIYKQSVEKMKRILTLYQLMQEVAVDCLVLNDFHKNGNKIIQCHKFDD
jgi:chromosome segregation ATPase